jgi:hypothetical protein
MQRVWPEDELMARWSLAPEDLALVRGMADSGKLGLSAQLAFWRQHGRFPDDEADLAPMVLAHLAAQVGVAVGVLEDTSGRAAAGAGIAGWSSITLRSPPSTLTLRPSSGAG